jgi:glutamine synthetase
VLTEKYIEELFEKMGVLSPVELESRYEVYAEQYLLSIEVEAKLVISMAKTTIYPTAMKYLSNLTNTMASLKDIGIEVDQTTVKKVADLADAMMAQVHKLSEAIAKHDFESTEAHLQCYAKTICPLMDGVRKYADALEAEIADELWPLPTYQEMLFIK